jgi:acyl-coenzyme A synthetase/AMP-(fatty) acid ligase
MARATEYGVEPQQLRQLAATAGHPEWAASADLIEEYRSYLALAREFSLDSAELVQFAATALTDHGDERIDALRLVIVDELPKTATGKIQRFALRERLAAAAE